MSVPMQPPIWIRFDVTEKPKSAKELFPHKEEAQSGDVGSHRPHGELLLNKQVGVIPPKSLGAELIEATAAVVALAGAKRMQAGANRGRGIIAPDQFVVHPLEQCRHRSYLL